MWSVQDFVVFAVQILLIILKFVQNVEKDLLMIVKEVVKLVFLAVVFVVQLLYAHNAKILRKLVFLIINVLAWTQ